MISKSFKKKSPAVLPPRLLLILSKTKHYSLPRFFPFFLKTRMISKIIHQSSLRFFQPEENIKNPNTISNSSKKKTPENSEILSFFERKHQRLEDSFRFFQKNVKVFKLFQKVDPRQFRCSFTFFQKKHTKGPKIL